MSEQKRARFGSKLGIILATTGGTVGLGNVWRFPYMTGQNGGTTFILVYIGCILLSGLPYMISEFIIGRHAVSNTARACTKLSSGSVRKWVGYLGVLTGFLITGYYAVVSGWRLQYGVASIMNHLYGIPDYFKSYFTDFSTNPWRPVLWTVAILFLAHYIIIHGVRNGIERASKIMMSALFALLVAIVVAPCLLLGASKGVKFPLKPDFSKVTGDIFLGALGQSFYSISIAMGCICMYTSYYSRHTKLLNSAVQIGVINTCAAILAGLMIFPAAFSVGVGPDSGPSLIFITFPNVFEQAFTSMPIVGYIISMAFYLLLSMTALTSSVSLHEVSIAFFQEKLHTSHPHAAMIVTAACSLIGAVCSLSLGEWSLLKVAGVDLFDLFDFVTGQIFLPIGGLLACLFIGWYVPKKLVKNKFTNWGTTRGIFFGAYYFLVRFVCLLAILAIFLHQLGVF